jgi:hypothetical protein
VLVPREAQGARPSENARALLLHGVLKGASVHRYLTFALLRDASSPIVRRRLIDVCVCAPRDLKRLINSESFKEALRKALGE